MTAASGIEIRGVSKIYGTETGGVTALQSFDLDLAAGEFVAIVGPSGCGKSTLMRLVAGLTPASSGSISVFGKAVTGPLYDCGIVFQQPILLEWRNVLENVLFQIDMRGLSLKQYEPRARDLLRQVGLADFADKRPYELSGGMKQRVALARALAPNPSVLLMDEPFGALDALTREQLYGDIQRIWSQHRKTIVFVTHNVREAVCLGNRVILFSPHPGRIREEFAIPLPRPRDINSVDLARYSTEITRVLKDYVQTEVAG